MYVADRYERRYIERWLQQGNLRCPATGQRLARPVALTPNGTLRRAIEEWAEKNAPWMLVRLTSYCFDITTTLYAVQISGLVLRLQRTDEWHRRDG